MLWVLTTFLNPNAILSRDSRQIPGCFCGSPAVQNIELSSAVGATLYSAQLLAGDPMAWKLVKSVSDGLCLLGIWESLIWMSYYVNLCIFMYIDVLVEDYDKPLGNL